MKACGRLDGMWTFVDDLGSEVYALDATGRPLKIPLKKFEDLREGLAVSVAEGGQMVVFRNEEGFYLSDGKYKGLLVFNGDARECWICLGKMSLRPRHRVRPYRDSELPPAR